jgi:hypothetical protein
MCGFRIFAPIPAYDVKLPVGMHPCRFNNVRHSRAIGVTFALAGHESMAFFVNVQMPAKDSTAATAVTLVSLGRFDSCSEFVHFGSLVESGF